MAPLAAFTAIADPALPIKSGTYQFQHRDMEFPGSKGFHVTAKISGYHIRIVNTQEHGVIPRGLLSDATLMWHKRTKQWILGHHNADRYATEVGGCSDGPQVVDLARRIYWTCEGGP